MKNRLFFILLCIGVVIPYLSFSQTQNRNIHIKLADTTALSSVKAIDSSLVVERIFPYSPKHESKQRKSGLHLWYKVVVEDVLMLDDLLNRYAKLSGVEKVDVENFMDSPKVKVFPVSASALRTGGNHFPVNDPLYPKQWDMTNHLYTQGVDINLEKAWQLEKGSRDVIVAVFDGAFDVEHEDLKPNVWVNELELKGKEGVDDDNNGYVDDIYGYDYNPDEPIALSDHGTHVAGTIAAVNNNGIGVCGIAGGDGVSTGVKLMRCHIFNSSLGLDKASDEETAQAFVYAANNGAVIAQNSWNGTNSDVLAAGIKYFMENAGDYAGSPMKGGLVVWSSGNSNTSVPSDPENNTLLDRENMIVVSSVGPDGDKASYSNYGDWVDISAPGGEYNKQGILNLLVGNKYGYMYGTSMACPHVSGIAALVVSKYKSATLTPKEVRKRVLKSVNSVNCYSEGQVTYGLMGAGIADAWKSLLSNKGEKPNPVTDIWVNKHSSQMIELGWRIPEDKDDFSIDSCMVYYSTSPIGNVEEVADHVGLYTGGLSVGDTMKYMLLTPKAGASYYFKVRCQDRWGNYSDTENAFFCPKGKDSPIICGDYLYNKFYTYQRNESYENQNDSLKLEYRIVAPEGMKISYKLIDEGKAARIESYKDNRMNLVLAPVEQVPGWYDAQIIVADSENRELSDTLFFSYKVRSALEFPIPQPVLLPGKSLNFVEKKLKGTFEIDLLDYFMDPNGGELDFSYDSTDDRELTEDQPGYKGRVEGHIFKMDYEFTEDLLSKGSNSLYFYLAASSIYGSSKFFSVVVSCILPTSNERVEKSIFHMYPNPVDNVLHLQSSEKIKRLCVYSIKGNMVFQVEEPVNLIDLSSLPSGVYFVQIITAKENVVKKIIKK